MGGQEYSYTVLFEPVEEGGYVVTCPALPGVVTQGETLDEARAMAHPDKPHRRVTVPVHPGDLKRRVLASIIKQAGLTTEEFRRLL